MNYLSKALIVVGLALASGVFGYVYQTGFFDVLWVVGERSTSQNRALLEQAAVPISEHEYRQRTQRGWSTGCGVGFALGLLLVIRLSRGESSTA